MRNFIAYDNSNNTLFYIGSEFEISKKIVIEVRNHLEIYGCLSEFLDENINFSIRWI